MHGHNLGENVSCLNVIIKVITTVDSPLILERKY